MRGLLFTRILSPTITEILTKTSFFFSKKDFRKRAGINSQSIVLPSSMSVAYIIRKFRWERSCFPFPKPPNYLLGTEKISMTEKGEFQKKL